MILQIVPYPGRIEHDIDAVRSQQFRGADAGELQQLRRVIGSAGDQDLVSSASRPNPAAGRQVLDSLRATSVEHDALSQRIGFNIQVALAPR